MSRLPLIARITLLYVVGGVLLFTPSLFFGVETVAQQDTNTYLSSVATRPKPVLKDTTISGKPVELSVPRLGIKLDVKTGRYDQQTKEWTLTDTDAFFAEVTDLPNNKSGNTLIYGHNRPNVLRETEDLKTGDKLILVATNGNKFIYEYVADEIVEPTDTSVVSAASNKPKVTLLTCNGLFSENRRLMSFEFIRVEEAK